MIVKCVIFAKLKKEPLVSIAVVLFYFVLNALMIMYMFLNLIDVQDAINLLIQILNYGILVFKFAKFYYIYSFFKAFTKKIS